MTNAIEQEIFRLENLLLTEPIRKSAIELERLLADDFIEFGSSGSIYNKGNIIESLPQEAALSYVIENFTAKILADNVVLINYKIIINDCHSLRSSIWKWNEDKWQMIFHQGTNTAAKN